MTLEEAIKILSELHDQCCQADSIFCTDTTGARCEAVEMAISALQAQKFKTKENCDTCKHNPPSKKWPCVDCDMRAPADRWEAQDVSDTNVGKIDRYGYIGIETLLNFCDNSKYHAVAVTPNDFMRMKRVRMPEPCEDAVSRKAAVEEIRRYGVGSFDFEDYTPEQAERFVIKLLQNLPSVTPEPCEDAVSRADVEIEIANLLKGVFVEYEDIAKKVTAKLPSVTPKRKTGRWLDGYQYGYKCFESCSRFEVWTCSECGKKFEIRTKCCPHCGAMMNRGE